MVNYLVKTLLLIVFSNIVIFFYYFVSGGHIENFNGYIPYLVILMLSYGLYKFFSYSFSYNPKKVVFKPYILTSLFFYHLFILCCFFFSIIGESIDGGIVLFFKIIYFSILPILTILGSYIFGDFVLSKIKGHDDTTKIFQFLIALGFGFLSFISLLVIFGIFGLYNVYVFFGLIVLFFTLGFKSLLKFSDFFFNYELSFNNFSKKLNSFYLLSTEVLFIIATLLISINLINIVRPMPIGWDDLGVYMNFPNLMAQAGSLLSLGSMYAWQVLTGIGYFTGGATQAFFFNSIGGTLSFLVIYLIVKDLFGNLKKTFINIPLLLATTFLSMPMVIFQLAKDMKLDPGLFFVSSIAVYIFYKVLLNGEFKGKQKKQNYIYIFIAGLIIGFAFTIKFTTLLLLSGLLGVVFYSKLGTNALLGYLAIYFAIFTKLGLWSMMNVIYPKDNVMAVNIFSAISLIIGLSFFAVAARKYKNKLKSFFIVLLLVVVGFAIPIIPWAGKNIASSGGNISLGSVLSGKIDSFKIDYTKIYSDEKITEIKNEIANRGLTSTGTTQNEDFGRYFGYEEGINNYLKLPVNLTMQKNQGGEFTEITFIFLALIPIIFLFLPYRKPYYFAILGAACLILFLFFFSPVVSIFISNILSNIFLPSGYIVIFGLFLSWLLLLFMLDPNKKLMQLFKLNLVFTFFYTFLWTISAYGIVWYGIVMYLGFLLMIGISLYYLSNYDDKIDKKDKTIKFFGSVVVFYIFCFYFFYSSVPHTFTNLKNAGYHTYKDASMTANEVLFKYQSGYLEAIYTLNIDKEKRNEFLEDALVGDKVRKVVFASKSTDILIIEDSLKRVIAEEQIADIKIKENAKQSLINIYNKILNPENSYKNNKDIYRIGTFLKYYISENNTRLFEDSLIFHFNDYIFNADANTTIENMEKLGLGYLLVDLNAATIDKDARRNLTKRYEKLLGTFYSNKLSLVASDGMCLRVGIDKYNKSEKTEKDLKEYYTITGANYESYDEEGNVTYRTQKQALCYQAIIDLINTGKVNSENYNYLLPILSYLKTDTGIAISQDSKALINFFRQYVPVGRYALFEIN